MSGISTASAVLELGRQNLGVMQQVNDTVKATLDRAAQERAAAADIYSGLIGSVAKFEQMRQDEVYRSKQLELSIKDLGFREKQLAVTSDFNERELGFRQKQFEVNSTFKESEMLLDEERLRIAGKQADAQATYYEHLKQKGEEADKYKEYTNGLQRQAATILADRNQQMEALDAEIRQLQTDIYGDEKRGIPGMPTAKRYLEQKKPDGAFSRLSALSKRRDDFMREQTKRLNDIASEINNVNAGGEPGRFIPLESSKNTKPTIPYRPGVQPSAVPATPSTGGVPALPSGRGAIDASLFGTGESETNILQVESMSFQNDPTSEQVSEANDQELMGMIMDKSTPIDDVPGLVSILSPKGKTKLEESRKLAETAFLNSYAASKNYRYDAKADESKEFSEYISDKYTRVGGNAFILKTLENEAQEKMMQLENEFISANSQRAYPPAEKDMYVASKYKEWVLSRHQAGKEAAASEKEKLITEGGGVAAESGLKYPGESDEALDVNSFIKTLESSPLLGEEAKLKAAASSRLANERLAAMEQEVKEFNKAFWIIPEDDSAPRLKKSFATFVENELAKEIDFRLGSSTSRQYDYLGMTKEEFKRQQIREGIKKIITAPFSVQFKFWKDSQSAPWNKKK